MSILDRIGNTHLLALRHVVPANGTRILLKLEAENPTGSMKDRMALAMIAAAEADGRLKPGGTVVEYTGGSTGVSLALVCAVKRYPLRIVTSDAFAQENLFTGYVFPVDSPVCIVINTDDGAIQGDPYEQAFTAGVCKNSGFEKYVCTDFCFSANRSGSSGRIRT